MIDKINSTEVYKFQSYWKCSTFYLSENFHVTPNLTNVKHSDFRSAAIAMGAYYRLHEYN